MVVVAALVGYGVYLLSLLGPGNYVKIYAGSYLWELRLVFFLMVLVGLVLGLYFLISLIRLAWRSPKWFSNWRLRSNKKRSEQNFGSGYLSLIKGDWRQAEKSLLNKSNVSGVPYVNYLAAAQAAQRQNKTAERDQYLNTALKTAPKEQFAIGLTKARLHLDAGELDKAQTTLADLQKDGRKNSQYLSLAMQANLAAGNWDQALEMLPSARKFDALPRAQLDRIADTAYSARLRETGQVTAVWKSLPKDQKARQENIALYAHSLIELGDHTEAENVLKSALKKSLDTDLIRLFGSLESGKPVKLRKAVEGWLKANPNNAELRLVAGRFAKQEGKLDVAETHLQAAIQTAQLPQAYAMLGDIYESGDESGKALSLYRLGMSALSKTEDKALTEQLAPAKEGELVALVAPE